MEDAVLICSHCGDTFSTDDEGWASCLCGKSWCSSECAEKDGYQGLNCNYCRGDDFEDSELLEFLTASLGIGRDDLVTFYREYKKELKNNYACHLGGYIGAMFVRKGEDSRSFKYKQLGEIPKGEGNTYE